MILDDTTFELQAGSEAVYRWTLADLDLTDVTEAKFVVFALRDNDDYGPTLLSVGSASQSGNRLVVIPGSHRVDLILPGSETKNLVKRGSEFSGRFQAELRFADGSEIIFARGEATIARDAQP